MRALTPVVCTLLVALCALPAMADDAGLRANLVPAPVEAGSSEAALESIDALVSRAMSAGDEPGRRLVRSIERRGGWEAAEGLARLARRAAPEIRIASLQALGRLGIRTRYVLEAVRSAARYKGHVEEQSAALEALGRVGDGDDVELLLTSLRATKGKQRSAAYRALGSLSGERLPASPRRIELWWKRRGRRIDALHLALEALPEAVALGDHHMLPELAEKIGKYGWLDLPAVSDAVEDWLRSDAPATRTQALMVISRLRLGDFVNAVERMLDGESSYANEDGAAREAARVLGIALDRAS